MKHLQKISLIAFLSTFQIGCAQNNTAELYATLNQAVGNVAYTEKGTLVFSHHPFFKPEVRVAKYNEATKTVVPFPNKEWNTPKTKNDFYLDDVLGIRNDTKGIVWMLDMGTRNNITPKFVGWNTKTNSLEKIYYIPEPASIKTSQLNDFVVDLEHQVFVIADEDIARGGDGSQGALVIVDMKTGKTRRVLEGHRSTKADVKSPIIINGATMSIAKEGQQVPIFVGADGITLDHKNEWLYYAPLSGHKLYRIRMTDLLNESFSDADLDSKIEIYSNKPNNGGLSIDKENNIYFTNIESKSIGKVAAKTKEYSIVASNDNMLWPDGISYNKDGYMYVSAAQVYLGAPFNKGVDKTKAPFYIFRFKPNVEGIFGR